MPELLLAIKAEVDRARRPVRFLLTGSSHLLGAPQLADSLAGRMEALTLWPFTQAELDGAAGVPALIDSAFGAALSDLDPPAVARSEVLERAGAGGFLPAPARAGRRRNSWFDSYVAGVIDREVRALTDATYLRVLPRLLRLCAARTSGELNVTDLARDLGLFRPTTDSHLAHLEAVFLIQTLPALSTNLTALVLAYAFSNIVSVPISWPASCSALLQSPATSAGGCGSCRSPRCGNRARGGPGTHDGATAHSRPARSAQGNLSLCHDRRKVPYG